MFIEAIDKLRCIQKHEDSWLVAKFVEMRDRDFWEGELGCPLCEARYPVRNGIVYFSATIREARDYSVVSHSPDELFALAAMLDLSASERTVVLCDGWSDFALALSQISEPHLFTLNPAMNAVHVERLYPIVTEDRIPLAANSVDAVALDKGSSPALTRSAVAVLRDGGRLIGKSGVTVPAEVLLLASDETHWVAQKQSDFIPLRRANR